MVKRTDSNCHPDLRMTLDRLLGLVIADSFEPIAFQQLILELREAVDRRFALECDLYDEALQNRPWIASRVRELKQRQQALRVALDYLSRSSRLDHVGLRRTASDFVEQFVEHEAGVANLQDDTFPAPSWTEEEPEELGDRI
jgi:hypothetical protein